MPAVVVLHGSGGMWQDDDREAGIMSRQNREWKELFNDNCIIGAYVDSYTPRGCIEREGDWTVPPKAFLISAQFVRPADAYAALSLLRTLRWADDSPVVQEGSEGLLGFSDGATSLAAAMYDTNKTPENWEWTQKYDDNEYAEADGVKPPIERPEDGGFACAVFYYGGSVGNSYWGGNPCSNSNFMYVNYAPILYQIPEDGYLTENSLCAIAHLEEISAPVEKHIYDNSEHGFDGDQGASSANSDLARSRSIDWFKKYFTK